MKNCPRKALSARNSPRQIPLLGLAVWWLLLDRFNAPAWLYSAVAMLALVLLTVAIVDFFSAEDFEIGGPQ